MHLTTDISFKEYVLDTKGFVLCAFQTDWSLPCRQQLLTLTEVVIECSVPVFTMNIEKQIDTCLKYNIQTVPTLMLFQDGVALATLVGYQSRTRILTLLRANSAL